MSSAGWRVWGLLQISSPSRLVLFFLTAPLGSVPICALAAVVMVSSVGLFDFATLRDLYRSSRRELLLSVATTLGVLLLGVLKGVLLAAILSLLWLLAIGSRPHDAVLGRVPGVTFGVARVKRSLGRFFDPQWMRERSEQNAAYRFATLKSAVRAFNTRRESAQSADRPDTKTATSADTGE